MLEIVISIVIVICSALLVYCTMTAFTKFSKYEEPPKQLQVGDIKSVPLLTDKVIVLSRENCPYCTLIKDKLTDYKDYTIVIFNPDSSLTFNSGFTDMPLTERDSVNKTIAQYIVDSKDFGLFFPTVFHGDKVSVGLPPDDEINKIFKK